MPIWYFIVLQYIIALGFCTAGRREGMIDNKLAVHANYKLIISVVEKNIASKVVAASKKAGAQGGTIIFGRGTSKKSSYLDFFGLDTELEKGIILTLVREEKADDILQAISREAKLDKPGHGVAFVVNTKGLTGIFHLLKLQQNEEMKNQ